MGLNATHWYPVIPRPTFTTDALGCQTSVGVRSDERFALYFHKMADIGLVVVILGGMSHFSRIAIEGNESYSMHARERDAQVHQWLNDLVYETGRVLLEGICSEGSVVVMMSGTVGGSLSPVIKSPSMTLS